MNLPSLDAIAARHHSNATGFSRHYLTLYSIALGLEAKNVFEFGCGFSTQVLLKALQETGGRLTTCDQRAIKDTGNDPSLLTEHADRFTYLQGDSLKEVGKIGRQAFDLALHDASHTVRVVYQDLRNILPRMKRNGIILVHDTEHTPSYHLKIAVFLALFGIHHEKVTLPYGYGLTIIRVLADYGNGRIETTWKKDRKKSEKS